MAAHDSFLLGVVQIIYGSLRQAPMFMALLFVGRFNTARELTAVGQCKLDTVSSHFNVGLFSSGLGAAVSLFSKMYSSS